MRGENIKGIKFHQNKSISCIEDNEKIDKNQQVHVKELNSTSQFIKDFGVSNNYYLIYKGTRVKI